MASLRMIVHDPDHGFDLLEHIVRRIMRARPGFRSQVTRQWSREPPPRYPLASGMSSPPLADQHPRPTPHPTTPCPSLHPPPAAQRAPNTTFLPPNPNPPSRVFPAPPPPRLQPSPSPLLSPPPLAPIAPRTLHSPRYPCRGGLALAFNLCEFLKLRSVFWTSLLQE